MAQEVFHPGADYWGQDNWHQWPPGTVTPPPEPQNYSNVGFGVLGYLLELLGRRPFPALCRKRIFDPLGMRSTGWLLRDIDVTRHAIPYLRIPDHMTAQQAALCGPLDFCRIFTASGS